MFLREAQKHHNNNYSFPYLKYLVSLYNVGIGVI
jgi:hypothetical protein